MTYDIYYYTRDGRRARVNWPAFLSPLDAVKALAMTVALPSDIDRAAVEDEDGQWIAEVVRKERA